MNERCYKVVEWCKARIGYPYVMGATNKGCTPSYREERARQYPGSADNIRKNCPVLNGTLKNCGGCKYEDMECFDCAQFARYAMRYVGIELVSGATSQWSKTKWAEQGKISSLPKSKISLVYRQDNPTTMGHVGVYTGDGYVIHAKGSTHGVVRELVTASRWSHYGIPEGLYDSITDDINTIESLKDRLLEIAAELECLARGI